MKATYKFASAILTAHTRPSIADWRMGVPVVVTAKTQDTARAKAEAFMGDPPAGYVRHLRLEAVTEES